MFEEWEKLALLKSHATVLLLKIKPNDTTLYSDLEVIKQTCNRMNEIAKGLKNAET